MKSSIKQAPMMQSHPPQRGPTARQRQLATALAVALAAVTAARAVEPWVAPADASALANPISASADSVKKGRAIYDDRCADCHGRKGRGDGPGGNDLERKPTDLTTTAFGGQSDGAIFWKLTQGRKPMPSYTRKLSEEERWQVIHYLRALAPKPKQRPASR